MHFAVCNDNDAKECHQCVDECIHIEITQHIAGL